MGHSLSLSQVRTAVSGRAFSRSARKQPDQTRVASMPDTAWPINGHPPGSSRDSRYIPVSMSSLFLSTRHQRIACARLPDPHLTHQVRLFPHRSPRQSSANAAVGGLKPLPAERLRRAYLHLPRSTTSRGSTYIKLLSAFVTHTSRNDFAPRPVSTWATLPPPRPTVGRRGYLPSWQTTMSYGRGCGELNHSLHVSRRSTGLQQAQTSGSRCRSSL